MSAGFVRRYTEPEEYAAAFQQGPVKFAVLERGAFTAKLCTINFDSLWMQRSSEELARTSHVDVQNGRAFIAFRTQLGPPVIRNGVELTTNTIARLALGQSYYQHTSGATSHAGMSLPLDQMLYTAVAMIGEDVAPPNDDLTIAPPSERMDRLQRLSATAEVLAEDSPAVLAHPEAARGLEQALIEAMMDCLGGGEVHEDRSAQRQHAAIMRRFYTAIERHVDEPVYIPELCREIGASERTLRACCHEHLGTSPKHYLWLRRMHLARCAMRQSTPAETTVTEIAMRYGFWQLGRFAVEYKALFGEMPSATLAQSG